jgi:flagellar basal-body rod protein FlgF
MNVSLYQAAAALDANSQWLDVITDNLGAGSVPGFRKQSLSTAAVQAGLVPVGSLNASSQSPQYFSIPQSSVSTSFKAGQMDYTGDDKNAAIDGPGFFQVQLPNGTPAVTRDGEFQINSAGDLTTKEGYIVQSDSGNPIKLDVHNHAALAISASGQVMQGEAPKGKLGLVDYTNPELLKQTDGVYFLADDPKLATQPATGTLREGYVEASNANSLSEMGNMMTAMRSFEANQHIIEIQDDRLGKVINDLGNPSSG